MGDQKNPLEEGKLSRARQGIEEGRARAGKIWLGLGRDVLVVKEAD